jgi:hypothetical protein
MPTAKLSLTSRELTNLLLTSRFQYWAEPDGKGLVFGVKNVVDPHTYQQAMLYVFCPCMLSVEQVQ